MTHHCAQVMMAARIEAPHLALMLPPRLLRHALASWNEQALEPTTSEMHFQVRFVPAATSACSTSALSMRRFPFFAGAMLCVAMGLCCSMFNRDRTVQAMKH
jgi:hypothetical protein